MDLPIALKTEVNLHVHDYSIECLQFLTVPKVGHSGRKKATVKLMDGNQFYSKADL